MCPRPNSDRAPLQPRLERVRSRLGAVAPVASLSGLRTVNCLDRSSETMPQFAPKLTMPTRSLAVKIHRSSSFSRRGAASSGGRKSLRHESQGRPASRTPSPRGLGVKRGRNNLARARGFSREAAVGRGSFGRASPTSAERASGPHRPLRFQGEPEPRHEASEPALTSPPSRSTPGSQRAQQPHP
jgi:hypothetical protein